MKRTTLLTNPVPLLRRSLLLVLLGLLLLPALAAADGGLSEAFTTTEPNVATGSLVDLKSGSTTDVESATLQESDKLLGVVGSNTLIQINNSKKSVNVVVTGTAPVLVSDLNGPVKTGDRLGSSPIVGVAMKATKAGFTVGTAGQDLSRVTTTAHTVKDTAGKAKSVNIGLVSSQIGVNYYAPPEDKLKPLLPSFLLTIGQTIAGKDISGIRVIISLGVLVLGFLTAAVMLNASIRAGIGAMGRNPLAHKAIRQGLVDVTVTGLVVLVLTAMIMYIVLTS